MKPVRVLVVDDSATMRSLIAHKLSGHSGIEVVGQSGDPIEARAAIKALNPDVMTLDVEMPNMNGLDFLEKVMRLRPMPVVMVSTLTRAGADATLDALEIGRCGLHRQAVDHRSRRLRRPAAEGHRRRPRPGAGVAARPHKPAEPGKAPQLRLRRAASWRIGASTGGVEALLRVLSAYPKECPPTTVDHPAHARRLHRPASPPGSNRVCTPTVKEAEDDAPSLQPGVDPSCAGRRRPPGDQSAARAPGAVASAATSR